MGFDHDAVNSINNNINKTKKLPRRVKTDWLDKAYTGHKDRIQGIHSIQQLTNTGLQTQ